ncbi:MAG TPA: SAM-dependent methyltransferase [Arenimonas sp.]|uniref:class I SAM-dependent methyltransferase n=1 Tax=Arenimonas sp. TaxID=1872635 RepID=UPI002BD366EB|nr:SAM-dependent methyltransferase [Arenimonas sp.]HMB57593.1 SAM-dependent methyltransferase [Arenimonas sp.]
MTDTALPAPGPEARAHSERLVAAITAQIDAGGGAIAFSRFMDLALYAPGLGYYSAGARKFGADGDFVTSPELGAAFAECVIDSLSPVLREIGNEAVFLELGAGSGAFALAALEHFSRTGTMPAQYWLLEPSADLRERQQILLRDALPAEDFARCRWLDNEPTTPWRGVLFANEVIDALPATRFVIRGDEVREQCVGRDGDGNFCFVERPADAALREIVRAVERDLDAPFAEGYCSEILPQLPAWIAAIAEQLQQGVMLFVDYGYPRREFYLPERRDGTLVCHYRHRAHNDPLFLPGLQDLTAFVDFTALAEAGTQMGFEFAGYCTQASFLINNGLADRLAAIEAINDLAERYRRHQEIKKLTLPGEMGERFQVMGFQRGIDFSRGMMLGDLRRRL